MESSIEQHQAFVGIDERGRIRVNFDRVRPNNDIPAPRDLDADPTTEEGWAAMLQREGVRIRGGRGGGGNKKEVVVPFVQHDVRLPEIVIEVPVRFCTRLTFGEVEFYRRRPGVALEVLREEVARIVADGTITIQDQRVTRNARKMNFELYGLSERQVTILHASRSAVAALSVHARAKDGDRIRRREGV